MTISISRALLNRILADAAKDSGAERCGLLLGEAARICDVRFAANVAPEPACHFELDPAVLLDAHRTARNGGSRVRSEERRVGKEGVSTCRSRWSPYH